MSDDAKQILLAEGSANLGQDRIRLHRDGCVEHPLLLRLANCQEAVPLHLAEGLSQLEEWLVKASLCFGAGRSAERREVQQMTHVAGLQDTYTMRFGDFSIISSIVFT